MPTDSHSDDPNVDPASSDTSSLETSSAKPLIDETQSAPTSIGGIIRRLGPGLIVAGSIVGSGELIATTSTGAQAGFWLLWLILIGCVIKVFVQVEFGRHAITSGKTTMSALSEVPGPRIKNRGNWLIWYWFAMFVASIAQLGGIVGGVGQALSISAPVTSYGSSYNQFADAETQLIVRHSISRAELLTESAPESARNWQATSVDPETAKTIFEYEKESLRFRLELIDKGDLDSDVSTDQIKAAIDSLDEIGEEDVPLWGNFFWLAYELYANVEVERDNLVEKKEEDDGLEDKDEKRLEVLNKEHEELGQLVERKSQELRAESFLGTYRDARRSEQLAAPIDDKIWAGIIAALTAIILINGRFGLIQSFSTAMVASFTAITVVNLFMLQSNATWGVSLQDIINGMKFRLPPSNQDEGTKAIATALQTFGIIGVGATELITYPYWCLEKGYARYTGPRDKTSAWAERAKGWLRVMRWDAWCSMFVYTFATIAFYLLGAAVLQRSGLEPAGTQLIRYLAVMYEPVFGSTARLLFLFGAFAVLYSTYFVANASHARVFSDALRVLGIAPKSEVTYRKLVRIFSGLFPMLCFVIYVFIPKPTQLVLLSGLMQAMMLPMLAAAALYFRYRQSDERLLPNKAWDVFLWISAIGMLIAGVWAGLSKLPDILALFN